MSHEDRTMRTARALPFSPEQVYGAFEAPEVLASWWGPDGFTNTFETFSFEVDGRWTFVMHGPDGASYPNQNVFKVLEPGRTVVIRHDCAPYFTLTVRLSPAEGGTHLTWEQVFDDATFAANVRHIVVPANEQNLDRMARALEKARPEA
jgi:uncharacterized protein YndB with AHSA1/START domain